MSLKRLIERTKQDLIAVSKQYYCLKKFKLVKSYQKELDALGKARNSEIIDKRGML